MFLAGAASSIPLACSSSSGGGAGQDMGPSGSSSGATSSPDGRSSNGGAGSSGGGRGAAAAADGPRTAAGRARTARRLPASRGSFSTASRAQATSSTTRRAGCTSRGTGPTGCATASAPRDARKRRTGHIPTSPAAAANLGAGNQDSGYGLAVDGEGRPRVMIRAVPNSNAGASPGAHEIPGMQRHTARARRTGPSPI